MNSRISLIAALERYDSPYGNELNFKNQFLTLLKHDRCYHRDFLPGHMTGSAWIVDETQQFVLLTLHAKLNRWLQPGGHADGDENIFDVALREAVEETGLKSIQAINPHTLFDIDVHVIPSRQNFPTHDHYDIRFLFQAERDEALTITDESHDLKWVALKKLEALTDNESLLRMRDKVTHFRS
jgi:8-oxo-dGTP pyrophosphatase MutT (NUDIX family)